MKVVPGAIQGYPKVKVQRQQVLLGIVVELLAPVLGLTCMHTK